MLLALLPLLTLARLGVAAELTPDEPRYVDALSLVDRLGWAAGDRDVARYLKRADDPEGIYARSFRPGDRERAERGEQHTLYAVEAVVHDPESRPIVEVREAVVFTNPTREPLEFVMFRVFPDGLEEGGGVVVQGAWADGRRADWALEDTVMVVALHEPLPPGRSVRLLLHLTAFVPWFDARRSSEQVDQLAILDSGAFGASEGWLNLGNWLPLVPALDEEGVFDARPLPANGEMFYFDPALFHVVLDFPSTHEVATTGIEVARERSGGRTTSVAVAAAVRDFAVALVPSAGVVTADVGETRVRVLHPAGRPALGQRLLEHATAALAHLEQIYGPLPAAELDLVEAPLSVALGVEFSQLMMVDALHDERPAADPQLEWTVAHEIAHQWWYGEVGNDAGGSPWLDEGLANHGAALVWESRHGRQSLADRLHVEVVVPYLEMRRLGLAELPANLPAWRYDLSQYANIVYGRTLVFWNEIRGVLGEAAFRRAMQRYYRELQGRQATAADLLEVLRGEASDPERIDALYRRWILEAHGYEDLEQ